MKSPTKRRHPPGARAKSLRDAVVDSIVTRSSAIIEPEGRLGRIATAAYFRAEKRGFDPGHEVEDWLAAEAEVDAALSAGQAPSLCGDNDVARNPPPD